VFLGITGLRGKGYLESAELDAYDWSLRLRPTKISLKPSIRVVAITDEDIQRLGCWPMTAELLAKRLSIIMQQHSGAIAVDIYRF
jgi:CHASE2 domain-containing sensor protein